MKETSKPVFIPMLYLRHEEGVAAIEFYKKAFNAIEFRVFSNDDGTVHVAELEISGTMFRFHEEKPSAGQLSPHSSSGGFTSSISLVVADPDAVMAQAIAAGAKELSPMQDYDYGYRQGDLLDPFGHLWTIEKVI
ncbi:MAG TPA: VOC family protein [Mucilaginibacter sp.]|nr:VOC family protein [Mucilaginibacter sp.]